MLGGLQPPDEHVAGECALYLGERFNLEAKALLDDPTEVIEATARWYIRDDADVEALAWIQELIGWHGLTAEQVALTAQMIVSKKLEPCVIELAGELG